ncbi:MBL fold metallo-hydrolase, partial [Thioclava sp. BHET1]
HHHPDHIGLAGWFQTTQGAELVTTRSAWLLARMLHLDAEEVHKPETLAFWRASGMDPAIYATRAAERPFNYADVVAPLPLGYRRIAEGDALTMGGRRWRVHMGHGHAPEQATFWSCDDALVLGADQLLPSISPNLGVYASEPEADTVGDWLESCTRLAGLARPDQLVLPGHKLPFTGLPLRLAQLIDNHHGALARLLDHLAEPRRGGACFVPLFKREIGAESYGLALAETIGHLNHLHARGLVRRWRDAEGAWLWQRIAGA